MEKRNTMEKKRLYHIHRMETMDDIWNQNTKIEITKNSMGYFFQKLLESEKILIERYGQYDIDYIIARMEELKYLNLVEEEHFRTFERYLNHFYFLRREVALEEGRKIYAQTAPSRIHCLFLTDDMDLEYWKSIVGKNEYVTYLLELEGDLFVSSDRYFPDSTLLLEKQIEKSKEYWQPKSLTIRKEYLFQGKARIVK